MTVSKLDAVTAAAVDLARAAAEEAAEAAGDFGVGDYLGASAEGERVVTHAFACPHPGYVGWHWAVTLVRAVRAKVPTVNEVVLLPSDEALLAQPWVPWAERIAPGDLAPGMLLPLGDNDPRVVPGYTGGTETDEDSVATRVVVHELGLGRERLLSDFGRTSAAERWNEGEHGPDSPSSRLAPAPCGSCAFFVRLRGALGVAFGACANEKSPSDGFVVSIEHGCGAHSDVIAEAAAPLPDALWDTLSDDASLFD
ncbi:MAG TPA: DUF3027 domain-containing protein [Propionibacteriaceae bacterium]|nr:DUF3027 domain-containing protein [Propionibacteriaceae bacterium]